MILNEEKLEACYSEVSRYLAVVVANTIGGDMVQCPMKRYPQGPGSQRHDTMLVRGLAVGQMINMVRTNTHTVPKYLFK